MPDNVIPGHGTQIFGKKVSDGTYIPVALADDGSTKVAGSITAQTSAVASAAAPSYTEGSTSPLSMTLAGGIRVQGSFSSVPVDMLPQTGSVSTAAVLFTTTDTTGYFTVSVQITAFSGGGADTIVGEISNDGSSWKAVNDLFTGAATITATGEYLFPCPAKQFRLRQAVNGAGGTSTASAQLRGAIFPGVPPGAATSALQTSGNATLSTLALESGGNLAGISTVLGTKADAKNSATDTTAVSAISIWKQISFSIQAAAASLAGTLTVAAHALTAGSAIIGRVGIDQTTPGTTDSVTVATAQGMGLVIGAKADAKNAATDTTSISAMSVWKQISFSIQAAATSLAGTLTVATHAVTQSGSWVLSAGSAIIGKVGIDQTTPGTTDSVTVATGQGMGAVVGAKTDAKNAATDTTSVSAMSVWKQISASVQAIATSIAGIVTADPTPSTPFLANALSTTVVSVIGSAAKLDAYYIYNPNSTVAYVQIFDISGAVTLGTSTPKWSIGIPPTSAANLSGLKLTFVNAIKVAATTTATGSSAPSTALDCNFSCH